MDHNSLMFKIFSGILFGGALGNIVIILNGYFYIRRKIVSRRHILDQFIQEHKLMWNHYKEQNANTRSKTGNQ